MSKLKIAVVCALPKLNNGMLSVDAAPFDFLARNAIEADLEFFSPLPGHVPGSGRFRPRTYAALSDSSAFHGFDAILLWGDFLHARRFHADVGLAMAQALPELTSKQIEDRIYNTLLLEDAPEALLRKTICFGGSIYINGPADDWDERYRSAIGRLYAAARLVLTRDPLSAAFAQQYGAKGSALGVDAAFLLDPAAAPAPRQADMVGYSFGRGVRRNRLATLQARWFVSLCQRKAGLPRSVNLNWLDRDPEQPMATLEAKLGLIRQCRFVVTDTYHCAVSAWREGVPAICVGFGTQAAADPVSEKKKELLFSMFNARDFYVYAERLLPHEAGREAERVVSTLADAAAAGAIRKNIGSAVSRAESALVEGLRR